MHNCSGIIQAILKNNDFTILTDRNVTFNQVMNYAHDCGQGGYACALLMAAPIKLVSNPTIHRMCRIFGASLLCDALSAASPNSARIISVSKKYIPNATYNYCLANAKQRL